MIREPKVITELIEIREYELRDLDMSIPVYLAQYGKYYAIISIKAEKQVYANVNYFNFKLLWQTNKRRSLISR